MSGERLFVVLEAVEEDGFVVSMPDLPGCWTQGEGATRAFGGGR
jgi:predicted RNase H-like HicB family nuclease